jgi:hypothetical protein
MKPTAITFPGKTTLRSIIIDVSALALIYLVPSISHLVSLPVYFIEPMRLMLILALAHTSRNNAYFLALSLPLFSFIISAHPVLPKVMLIAMELSLNVFLFYFLSGRMKNMFGAVLLSILASKIVYYLAKFLLIRLLVIDSGLFSTPVYIQVVTAVAFSLYCALLIKSEKN